MMPLVFRFGFRKDMLNSATALGSYFRSSNYILSADWSSLMPTAPPKLSLSFSAKGRSAVTNPCITINRQLIVNVIFTMCFRDCSKNRIQFGNNISSQNTIITSPSINIPWYYGQFTWGLGYVLKVRQPQMSPLLPHPWVESQHGAVFGNHLYCLSLIHQIMLAFFINFFQNVHHL